MLAVKLRQGQNAVRAVHLLALLRVEVPTGCGDVKERLSKLPQAETSRLIRGLSGQSRQFVGCGLAHLSLSFELHHLLGDVAWCM